MLRSILISFTALVALLVARPANADRRIAEVASSLAERADTLARGAERSDDRGVRRRFAPRAADLSDDLSSLARRARKDAAPGRIAKATLGLARDAAELVELADEADDRRERKALRAQATQLERGIVALRRAVEANADAGDRRREDRRPARPEPMAPAAFEALVKAIKSESFDSNKLRVVRDASQGNNFVISQITVVMDLFSFSSGKIDAAVAMWPRALDPQNSFMLYEKLTFSSDKEKLRRRIGK